MSIPTDGPTVAESAAPAAAAVAPQHRSADDHWPICRCTHPMHPHRVELRRGVKMERFACPRRRWWNQWWHPYVPRGTERRATKRAMQHRAEQSS